ncbi:MAG TPA: hypothetical protein VHG09_00305 [Longimicrobiales bacterium]|nr:hypothetical protein [Longimicrobiales bacterium]
MLCVSCRRLLQDPEETSSSGFVCERCGAGRTIEPGAGLLRLLVILTNFGLTAAAPPLLTGTSEV